jgi:localization factor PodJL
MRSGVPWHIKVHPDVRDNAREAARRAGMSVSQWLNTVILDSALEDDDDDYDDPYAPPALRRRPRRDQRPEPQPDPGPDLTAIADRIEGLTEEVERLARVSTTPREAPPRDDVTARKLTEAIAKLDQRVETFIQEGRSATEALGLKVESVDRALSALGRERLQAVASDWVETASTADWTTSVDQACDEIAQRQRELEGEIFPAAQSFGRAPSSRARDDFSAIYDRLKQVSDQVEAFGAVKMREAVDALRNDLAEIAGKLVEASPRRAIEALEGEVRQLASHLDAGARVGGGGPELSSIESGLAEVRDAIRGLTPAESLSGAVDAIRVLSQKIDQMAAGGQDPGGLQKLEAAVAGLRGIVSRVASDDSLAALTAEVRTLSDRVTAGAANAGGSDILRNLEQRIGTIADAIETVRISTASTTSSALETAVRSLGDKIDRLQSVPEHISTGPDLGTLLGALGERIDRIQAPPPAPQVNTDHIVEMIGSLSEKIESLRASRGDSDVLRQIEDRIGLLSQKLEASESRLGNLDNIENGMKELLAYLENVRSTAPPTPPAAPPPSEHLVNDVMRTQESLEAAHGTIGDVVDRLAMIETGMRNTPAPPAAPQIASVRPATPQPAATKPPVSPRTASRIDDILPSDQPLEPGSGKPRPGSAAPGSQASVLNRIAASKAVAEPARAAAAVETEPKSSFIVAARRAAQAAAEDESTLTPRTAVEPVSGKTESKPRSGLFGRHIKSILVGASVAAIAAGAVHLAFSLLNSSDRAGEGQTKDPTVSSRQVPSGVRPGPVDIGSSGVLNVAPPSTAGANSNAGVLPQPPATPASNAPVSRPAPVAVPDQSGIAPAAPSVAPAAPVADVTGALVNRLPAMVAAPTVSQPAVQGGRGTPLPATIGSRTLISAAESGDVSAAYEVATRYADGRGIPLNPEVAAIWFDRAANGGIVPAMFRLGGLYEKGIGVKKDLTRARDLYIAAANRGSAKAMHNLAVLHADGFDGKPDYPAAIQWFRKAAARGVPDSQYNLGVLYARGIGVEQNFGESYRWFALAAQAGDQDAAQKRDDVAKRLDAQTLSAVRAAVQNWTPEPQPDDAVTVKAPPGGWDPGTPASVPAAAPKGKPKRV